MLLHKSKYGALSEGISENIILFDLPRHVSSVIGNQYFSKFRKLYT